MSDPTEIRHSIASTLTPLSDGPLRPDSLERLALTTFIDGNSRVMDTVCAQVDVWVSALHEPKDREEARMLLLARAIAASRAKCILLEAKREERLAARDEHAVRLLTTVLASETKRFTAFLAEHRLGCCAERRGSVTVAVGQVGTVNIAAGSRG